MSLESRGHGRIASARRAVWVGSSLLVALLGSSTAHAADASSGSQIPQFSCDVNSRECKCDGTWSGADCSAAGKNCESGGLVIWECDTSGRNCRCCMGGGRGCFGTSATAGREIIERPGLGGAILEGPGRDAKTLSPGTGAGGGILERPGILEGPKPTAASRGGSSSFDCKSGAETHCTCMGGPVSPDCRELVSKGICRGFLCCHGPSCECDDVDSDLPHLCAPGGSDGCQCSRLPKTAAAPGRNLLESPGRAVKAIVPGTAANPVPERPGTPERPGILERPGLVDRAARVGSDQVAPGGAAAAASASRLVLIPKMNGKRLDWCLHWGSSCGEPAASAFCKSNGFSRAERFEEDPDVGNTWVLGDRKDCKDKSCDGFKSIACVKDAPGATTPQRIVNPD